MNMEKLLSTLIANDEVEIENFNIETEELEVKLLQAILSAEVPKISPPK